MGGCVIKKILLFFLLPLFSLNAQNNAQKAAEPTKPAVYETNVTFQGFPWGTSEEEFIKKAGKPVSREENDGLVSAVWENIDNNGYTTYMLAYFSRNGLQGGTYYFLTYTIDELMKCYNEIQQSLRNRHGPTRLYNGIIREMRPYESAWDLPGGYIHLKVNTRRGEPVTLWYSSPELTEKITGGNESAAAKN